MWISEVLWKRCLARFICCLLGIGLLINYWILVYWFVIGYLILFTYIFIYKFKFRLLINVETVCVDKMHNKTKELDY